MDDKRGGSLNISLSNGCFSIKCHFSLIFVLRFLLLGGYVTKRFFGLVLRVYIFERPSLFVCMIQEMLL